MAACHNQSAVNPSKEMKEFMRSFDGSNLTIMNSLEKFKESANVNTDDLETKDLKKPEILEQRQENGFDIYVLKASDMERSYVYDIYWQKGKIAKCIEDITREKK
jgi:hypothetical protein